MDRLWTPWRYAYITGEEGKGARKGVPERLADWPADQDNNCVFCNLIAAFDYAIEHGVDEEEAAEAVYLVYRAEFSFICLNAYPYGSGHVMIIPYEHTDSLAALPTKTAQEMMHLMQRVQRILREVYQPDGMNFGVNLGKAGGAGITEHLHIHGLPRWSGDVNFMTTISDTRVLPETLDVSWAKLRKAMKQ